MPRSRRVCPSPSLSLACVCVTPKSFKSCSNCECVCVCVRAREHAPSQLPHLGGNFNAFGSRHRQFLNIHFSSGSVGVSASSGSGSGVCVCGWVGGRVGVDGGVSGWVCVWVCVPRGSFQSCFNCEVQHSYMLCKPSVCKSEPCRWAARRL